MNQEEQRQAEKELDELAGKVEAYIKANQNWFCELLDMLKRNIKIYPLANQLRERCFIDEGGNYVGDYPFVDNETRHNLSYIGQRAHYAKKWEGRQEEYQQINLRLAGDMQEFQKKYNIKYG